MIDVTPGTIVVYADVGCPFAHVAVERLHRARDELGLDGRVHFDHRAFPLEVVNERPTPKWLVDLETAITATMAPEAGWKPWSGPDSEYPVSTMPALEAVQAAKAQGLAAAEQLDRALRKAFFAESRCITLRHVVLDVARGCPEVDVDALAEALDRGEARSMVIEHWRIATAEGSPVKGSPHLFLPDGTDVPNPGVTLRHEGERPVLVADDPSIYPDVLRRTAGG